MRGRAHNVAGHGTCDGGIVIDLSPRRGISLDLTTVNGLFARAPATRSRPGLVLAYDTDMVHRERARGGRDHDRRLFAVTSSEGGRPASRSSNNFQRPVPVSIP